MKQLVIVAALLVGGCDGHNAQWPFVADKPKPDAPKILGNGQVIVQPGYRIIVGPASIGDNYLRLPVYVEEAPPRTGDLSKMPALSCIVFDEQKRLAGSRGFTLPVKYGGGSIDIEKPRDIGNGSIQCRLVTISLTADNQAR